MVSVTPQFFLPVYLHTNVNLPTLHPTASLSPPLAPLPAMVLQLSPCSKSSLPQLPTSAIPTSLDECFFFHSLTVGLPYIWVYGRSGYSLFLNLFFSLFWLCEEAKSIYLCLHLGWHASSLNSLLFIQVTKEGDGSNGL